jgi:acetyltransferase-like isoleucine patch superfamily enzyme
VVRLAFTWAPMVASFSRKRWARLKNPHARVEFGPHTYVGPGFSLHAPFGGTFIVGRGCEFRRGFRCELGGPETVVRFGDNCVATYDVLMQVTTRVEIGDRVMFGQSTAVFDGNHNFRDPEVPMLDQGYRFKPLRIEDDVTVLTKCTIVANVGERAVIGANSVVSRDVPAFHIVGGVPAKIIDTYGPATNGRTVGDATE